MKLHGSYTDLAEHRENVTLLKGDELQVYTRTDTMKPVWQARVNNPQRKGYITKSLKTADRKLAIERAEEWFDELRFKEKHGLVVHARTVSQICDLYLTELLEEIDAGIRNARHIRDYKPVVERYIKGFFGNKYIDNVRQRDVKDFTDWCLKYWTTGEGSKQKNKVYYRNGKRIVSPTPKKKKPLSASGMGNILYVLRGVFRTAVKFDAIREVDVPVIKAAKRRRNDKGDAQARSRSAFTIEEYRTLFRFMRGWVNKGRNENQIQRRLLLRDYVLILVNSGIRAGTESNGLCWKHVEHFKHVDGKEYPRIWVNGKTGERQLVAMPNVKKYLNRIKQRRTEYLGHEPDINEPVFSLPDGKHIEHDYMRSLFEKLLTASGLLHDALERKRVLYTCRHTYATFRLIYGRVSVYTLKENMGTSVEMIERHYGHLTPTLAAAELTQRIKLV